MKLIKYRSTFDLFKRLDKCSNDIAQIKEELQDRINQSYEAQAISNKLIEKLQEENASLRMELELIETKVSED